MEEMEWNRVYRRVRDLPQYIKSDGSITSAVFKDSKGASVDRDGGRTDSEIIADEERLHAQQVEGLTQDEIIESGKNLRMIVSVSREICNERQILVKPDPIKDNPYHALLQRNEEIIELSPSQAKALARAVRIEKSY